MKVKSKLLIALFLYSGLCAAETKASAGLVVAKFAFSLESEERLSEAELSDVTLLSSMIGISEINDVSLSYGQLGQYIHVLEKAIRDDLFYRYRSLTIVSKKRNPRWCNPDQKLRSVNKGHPDVPGYCVLNVYNNKYFLYKVEDKVLKIGVNERVRYEDAIDILTTIKSRNILLIGDVTKRENYEHLLWPTKIIKDRTSQYGSENEHKIKYGTTSYLVSTEEGA